MAVHAQTARLAGSNGHGHRTQQPLEERAKNIAPDDRKGCASERAWLRRQAAYRIYCPNPLTTAQERPTYQLDKIDLSRKGKRVEAMEETKENGSLGRARPSNSIAGLYQPLRDSRPR